MLALIMGPPRCGTTLVYNIARLIVERSGCGYGFVGMRKYFPEEAARYSGYGDPPTYTKRDLENSTFVDHDLFFVHHFHDPFVRFASPYSIPALGACGKLYVLYPHRDLRASVESHMRGFKASFDKAFGFLKAHSLPAYKLLKPHFDSDWLLPIAYNDLVRDMHRTIRDVGRFLGVSLPECEVRAIADACAPERVWDLPPELKGRELRNARRDAAKATRGTPYHEGTGLKTDRQEHVSKNKVSRDYYRSDKWKDVLTDAQVNAVMSLGDGWNSEMGYG